MTTNSFRARIAAGRRHSVGLTTQGSLLTSGIPNAEERRVDAWGGIVAVAVGNVHTASNTGRSHTVGLREDGTVIRGTGHVDGVGEAHVGITPEPLDRVVQT